MGKPIVSVDREIVKPVLKPTQFSKTGLDYKIGSREDFVFYSEFNTLCKKA